MSDLILKQLQVGPMANFTYLIGSRSKKECLVVDPAWDIPAIEEAAGEEGLKITGALVTHYHPDHCGGHLWGHDIQGVAELCRQKSLPIYANIKEIDGLVQVTGLSRNDFKPCRGGDTIEIGGVKITTIHTPGHTPGSQCFLCESNLVSGDTLFLTGCGRVDLPGGNGEELYDSLVNKISVLPKNTVVYPGHHYDPKEHATLEEVKEMNPYLNARSLADWRARFGR